MEQTGLKIALAGFLHDIGKFAQGCIDVSAQYANNNADQYQPFYNNKHTHIHALYTAAFIEQFADLLPDQFNKNGWGKADSFINLAAGHHKPETAMQWIISQADRISSGLDRATFEEGESIAFQNFKKTRLLPILEGLGTEVSSAFKSGNDFQYRYSLTPLTAKSIFPHSKKEKILKSNAENEYKTLFDTFIKNLTELQHKETNIELWANHFDSLFLTCTAMIPAARVGDVIHDVSLYDHARTTAAFASALYSYHDQKNSLNEESIRDNNENKFLLVTGDFYGIQDFIFAAGGEMKKFRSKILRGRSFAVSLFSELASDMLCRELELSFLSVVFNAAGKFTLIAPNTDNSKRIIQEIEDKINNWLFEVSYGQASLGIAVTAGRPSQFYAGKYGELHDLHMKSVQKRKLEKLNMEKYSGGINGYLESFNTKINHPLCSLCGKRPATSEASKDHRILGDNKISACPVCRDHVMLGTWLVKSKRLTIINSNKSSTSANELNKPLFGCYQLKFIKDTPPPEDMEILKMWQVSTNKDGSLFSDITCRPLHGYIPLYSEKDNTDTRLIESKRKEKSTLDLIDQINQGEPKTFTHIAITAKNKHGENNKITGTEAIGVLKADIDNLGLLMGCGLPEKQFTLSRMATLSRQLDAFFSIYLPHLLAEKDEFKNIYTVFAGGDDLFLLGPWNKIAYLSTYLQKRFKEYVCENNSITFSAGITLHKPHVPVDKLAQAADTALEQSKAVKGKNSVTMFGQTVKWQEFNTLLENRDTMQSWLDKKYISNAMMYRFNHLISLSGREKAALEGGNIYIEDLDAMKWRAMFSYSIQRNINKALKSEKRDQAVQDVSMMAAWMDKYGAAVRIPLWHLLYDRR